MAKTWYPVINYETCTECGACYKKCSHGVFTLKNTCPVVTNPDECVQGCHGCGNLCPTGSIEYVGDDTGWTPPGKKNSEKESCCEDESKKDNNCCNGGSGCC